ncbi:MAG TPA: DUF4389 domain-containing protein [Acidimicrobiia bacterium]
MAQTGAYPLVFTVDYPDRELNRLSSALRFFFVLFSLNLAAVVVAIIVWFAIVLTGRYPRGMFDFVVGVMRWNLRVVAYAFRLSTDRYPSFGLQP